jgi:MarC family integral membrane protein
MSRSFDASSAGTSPAPGHARLRASGPLVCIRERWRPLWRGFPVGFVIRALTGRATEWRQNESLRVTWQKFIGTAMLLYGLINPIGVIPIYLNLVQESGDVKSRRIIAVASLAVAGLLVCAAILGQQILNFFNVGLDDFRIAGGLLACLSRSTCSKRITADSCRRSRNAWKPIFTALRSHRWLSSPLRSMVPFIGLFERRQNPAA